MLSAALVDPAGPVGAGERMLLLNSLVIMLCIVVPTIVATLAFAWWFRAGNATADYLPDWAFSGRIEIVTWSVPLLTITFLGGIAWIGSHDLDPAAPLASTRIIGPLIGGSLWIRNHMNHDMMRMSQMLQMQR